MTNRKIILFCIVSLIAIGMLLAGRGEEPKPAGDTDGVMRGTNVPAAVSGDTVITSASGAALDGAGAQATPAGTGNRAESNEGDADGKADESKKDSETDPPASVSEAGHRRAPKSEAAKKKNSNLPKPQDNTAAVKQTEKKSSASRESAGGRTAKEGRKTAAGQAGGQQTSGQPAGADARSAQPATEPPAEQRKECFLQVSCKAVWEHADQLKDSIKKALPADGVIVEGTYAFEEGDTAFDVLKRACEEKGILIDYVYTPGFSTYYIKGIQHLYEFDCGDESGWMYEVNGRNPDVGCSRYKLAAGDRVSFYYTVKRSGV